MHLSARSVVWICHTFDISAAQCTRTHTATSDLHWSPENWESAFRVVTSLHENNTRLQLQLILLLQSQLLRPERAVYLRGETGRKLNGGQRQQIAIWGLHTWQPRDADQSNCRSVPLWNEAIAHVKLIMEIGQTLFQLQQSVVWKLEKIWRLKQRYIARTRIFFNFQMSFVVIIQKCFYISHKLAS